MASDDVLKATLATLTTSGLDVNTTTVRGACVVVVTDRQIGERYICRDADPWTALVQAAGQGSRRVYPFETATGSML